MAGVFSPGRAKIDVRTLRTDRWWLQPTITVAVLVSFIIYATFRAFEAKYYFAEPLISPFYSPCLSTACVEGSAHFGTPIGTFTIFGMIISLHGNRFVSSFSSIWLLRKLLPISPEILYRPPCPLCVLDRIVRPSL